MPPNHQYEPISAAKSTTNVSCDPSASSISSSASALSSGIESTRSQENGHSPQQHSHDDKFFATFLRTRPAVHVLLLTLLLSLGIGSVVSTVPGLLGDRFARLEYGYNGPPCSEFHDKAEGDDENDGVDTERPQACKDGGDKAQNAAASAAFAENMLMLVFSSVVGSMSDTRGRKPFLAVSFALLATTPLSLVIIQLFDNASPYWFYASRASHGIISAFTLCLTVLSDVMPPKMRTPSFGLFIATYYFGFAFSQVLAKLLSHMMVAVVATILLMSGCVFATLNTETLPSEARRKATAKRSEEGNSWARIIFRPVFELSILNRNKFFRLLAVVSVCSGMIYSSDSTLVIYYMKNRLDIGYQSIATMFFVKSLVGVLVQIFLLKALLGCLREKRSLVLGLAFGAVHNFLWGVSSSQLGIFLGMIMSEFTGLHFPILVGMRSINVGEDEQGRVQGAFFALAAIADAIGPVLLQGIYRRTEDTTRPGPGFMFVVAAGVYLFGAFVACALPADKANLGKVDNEQEHPEGAETDSREECLERNQNLPDLT